MPVKKLSIKKGKKGKLAIHKEAPVEDVEEDADDVPFEPDEIITPEAGEYAVESVKKLKVGKVGKPIQGTVAVKEQNEKEKVEQVDVEGAESIQPTGKPMANVGYGIDRTINLGDFESLKIHVTLHVPSEVDEDEIDGNYEFCKGWVEQKMNEVSAEYLDSEDD